MQMTISGADAEKLFALNKANALLAEEGVDWDRVLDRMVRLEVEDASHMDADRPLNERIEEAFRAVMADDPRGSTATFVASLHDQWMRRRSLSPRQQESLFKLASEARSR
jgi:hypothetical protein